MATDPGFMPLAPDSSTLSPLGPNLRAGLTAVAVLASISFASSASLFLYFTYKLVKWQIKTSRGESRHDAEASPGVDLSLGLAGRHFGAADPQLDSSRRKGNHPNQFLVLIYNLFLADMHQSGAFLLNSVWVSKDGILVGTPVCFLQGWLVSTGDLSSSCFIAAIAVHTYFTVVRGYRPPQWALNVTIVGIWTFVYGITIVGIAATHNGREVGGFYVRAVAWCWVNVEYEKLRLLTHYLFIFIALALTSVLYTLIFLHLRTEADRRRFLASSPPAHSSHPSIATLPGILQQPGTGQTSKSSLDIRTIMAHDHDHHATYQDHAQQGRESGHHPAFLIYPVIYVLCTAPLALGRIATMAGASVPTGYFCAAGALIACNGWLDVLLWGSTRRALVFGGADAVDSGDVGLDTFAFMRTPRERRFGNMVWVQGDSKGEARDVVERRDAARGAAGRRSWRWSSLSRPWDVRRGRDGGSLGGNGRSTSQESLRGSVAGLAAPGRSELAIQMDRVTTVVVEDRGRADAEADLYRLAHGLTMHRRDASAYSISGNESDREGAGLRFITSAVAD